MAGPSPPLDRCPATWEQLHLSSLDHSGVITARDLFDRPQNNGVPDSNRFATSTAQAFARRSHDHQQVLESRAQPVLTTETDGLESDDVIEVVCEPAGQFTGRFLVWMTARQMTENRSPDPRRGMHGTERGYLVDVIASSRRQPRCESRQTAQQIVRVPDVL
ncbi:hypothetical protein ACFVIM_13695 [Streptomyces sp. NPDC057638]|uniref:hypothetical protein n=1 Tax=Streptomyces sp. NPDC057638 TaxID=3346190 RepID=UPI0036B077AC